MHYYVLFQNDANLIVRSELNYTILQPHNIL